MQQVYHSNATTNINIRNQIQNNKSTNQKLASQFGVSSQTISKWKNRDFNTDKSSRPLSIQYALSDIEKALTISIRKASWMPLDELWETLLLQNRNIARSTVYRTLVKENLNCVPQEQREKAKKFKEYEPGFIHIDVTYLPKFDGVKYYLFVAIDRCTRTMVYWVYDNKTAKSTEDFMDKCIAFFPFKISHILTDNGLEFSNRLHVSKRGNPCKKLSKMDLKCIENNIEHRLIKPCTPKTNGMVERLNGIIKNDTILKVEYKNKNEMIKDLGRFFLFYNMYRRHGSLRRELNVKTPFDAVEKWCQLKPEIFKVNHKVFKLKTIDLQREFNQLSSITL